VGVALHSYTVLRLEGGALGYDELLHAKHSVLPYKSMVLS